MRPELEEKYGSLTPFEKLNLADELELVINELRVTARISLSDAAPLPPPRLKRYPEPVLKRN